MKRLSCISQAVAFVMAATIAHAETSPNVVTYEAFGAVGDGVADDLPAIQKAHAHANEHGLPVRSDPEATYHLGRQNLTAIIATDTDWSTTRFIIDDSQGVENNKHSLFKVRSRLKPVPLKIDQLKRGQERLDVRPPADCLVLVENKSRKIFIRRGGNQNAGTAQREVFILRRDGTIFGGIDWDYDEITRIEARPIDPEPLVVRGGFFTNIANRMVYENDEGRSNYWARNIRVERSNTTLDGLTLHVTGETDVGQPYHGFLFASQCADVTFRDCTVDARKVYQKIGVAGTTVPMGTYGYQAGFVVNFTMTNCGMGNDIHDRSLWGIAGTNFMKNILIEDSELSRMDVHQGVSGDYIIRNSTLGHAGLNAIGRGRLIVEDSTIHSNRFISFRQDYGSTWEGEVIIRNSRWMPPGSGSRRSVFLMRNDGTHDFGYPCHMPRVIRIDGLYIGDSKVSNDTSGITFFSDAIGPSREDRPFPYQLTERLEIRDLETASGLAPRISDNAELVKAVEVVK